MFSILDPEIKKYFPQDKTLFKQLKSQPGEIYRALENRSTKRVKLGDQYYFIKQHFGVGWKEIFKNIFQLRLPIVSAKNEWLAIERLHSLHIATQQIVGYGYCGWNPATRQSFLITKELPKNISLEKLCENWKTNPPTFRFKNSLIKEVARIAKMMHSNGINHRDFYICHFLLDLVQVNSLKLYLIDLHRAQIRSKVPARWIIKDLAGLYFSSKNIGLTSRDLLRFIREYRGLSLREIILNEKTFWQLVKNRGEKLIKKHEYSNS